MRFDHGDTATINGMNVGHPREVVGNELAKERWDVAGRQHDAQGLVQIICVSGCCCCDRVSQASTLARATGTARVMHVRAWYGLTSVRVCESSVSEGRGGEGALPADDTRSFRVYTYPP